MWHWHACEGPGPRLLGCNGSEGLGGFRVARPWVHRNQLPRRFVFQRSRIWHEIVKGLARRAALACDALKGQIRSRGQGGALDHRDQNFGGAFKLRRAGAGV